MTVAAGANFAVAFATLVLAFLTWRMANATSRAVEAAERQRQETQRAVDAAQEQARLTELAVKQAELQTEEIRRGRIDQSTHRLTVTPGLPQWPPFLEPPWQRNAAVAQVGTRFTMPGDGVSELWFRLEFLIRNEGATTAFITLRGAEKGSDARFVEGTGQFGGAVNHPVPPRIAGNRYALRPGETALVVFDSQRPLSDFVQAWERRSEAPPESKMHCRLIVSDHFEDGVADNIDVELQSYPVEPIRGDAGGWQIRRPDPTEPVHLQGLIGASVGLSKRMYRHNGAAPGTAAAEAGHRPA